MRTFNLSTCMYEYLKTTLVWVSTLLHRPPQLCVAIALVTMTHQSTKVKLSASFSHDFWSMTVPSPDVMTTKQKQDENTLCINRGDHDKSNTAQ